MGNTMTTVITWLVLIGVLVLFVIGINQEIKASNECEAQGGRWVSTDSDDFCVKKEFLIGN